MKNGPKARPAGADLYHRPHLWYKIRMRGVAVTALLLLAGSCIRMPPPASQSQPIDLSQEPYQEAFSGRQAFTMSTEFGNFMLIPRAAYRQAAVVVSSKRYRSGWEASLSPLDLAFVWGELSRSEVLAGLRFRHERRGYSYELADTPGFDSAYADEHIANAHIIPATRGIRQALRKIQPGDRVLLEGYLVDVFGTGADNEYTWKTSLSRSDRGRGACELLLLRRIQIKGEVFE